MTGNRRKVEKAADTQSSRFLVFVFYFLSARTPRACKQGCSYWDAWAHRPFDIYVQADKAAELYEKLGADHQHPEEERQRRDLGLPTAGVGDVRQVPAPDSFAASA